MSFSVAFGSFKLSNITGETPLNFGLAAHGLCRILLRLLGSEDFSGRSMSRFLVAMLIRKSLNLLYHASVFSFVTFVFFLTCVCYALCARLFICALWSPAGKGLTSWLSFVVSAVSLSLSHWYPGSGVVLDCIDS